MTDSSAVTVIEQSPDAVVEWNLDNWPTSAYNRLVPTQTLGLVSDFIRPLIVTVQLDVETDTYESKDLKAGHRAPNAKGLSKLADAAGVNFVDEVRLDGGSDPKRAYVRVYAEMIDGTGLKRRAPGSRDYILDSQPMTEPQRQRAKAFVHENAATRARHRALRALLSLPQSYSIADLQKPFAIARYVLNTQHPEIRDAVKNALVGAVAAVYGPEPARQLETGTVEVDEVPDDEPAEDDPAPSTPSVMPGERLAAAQGSDVAGDDALPTWATDQPATDAEPTLLARIRDTAEAGGMVGGAKKPQLEALGEIFGPLKGRATVGGLQALWPDMNVNAPTANQAQAIIGVSRTFETPEEFQAAWREMAGLEATS